MSSPDQGSNPELIVAIAVAAGVVATSLARHLRIPGIVLLLAMGVVLGPDVLGWIDPGQMEAGVHALVSFAVAIILFEGGLNLNLRKLRREAGVIQSLITLGALITAVGGTMIGRFIMEWDWSLSVLFGTLVIVTGPTVITPILRRIRIRHNVETILEAEGVFIDAVGAIIAAVALQIALQPTTDSFVEGLFGVVGRVGIGVVFGLIAGTLLALLLRSRRIVPEGLENIFVLGLIWLAFQLSNSILHESGIGTVTVAGVVMGNVRSRVSKELQEFKEQLTVMSIGLLFVLLAADVRIVDVQGLGIRGVLAVLALMFLVRPANIFLATRRSSLKPKEKLFLAWLAPRGIVAAAVASIFAQALADEGKSGGVELQAMVFLVIASTVVVQGMSGGLVAGALGLKRPMNQGFVILGASHLGRALGRALLPKARRGEITYLDSSADGASAAEREGFHVIFGNALEERVLVRAQVESRAGCIAVTRNEEINLLFARKIIEEFKGPRVYVGLQRGHEGVTVEMVAHRGARLLFRRDRDLELWDVRYRRNLVNDDLWQLVDADQFKEQLQDRERAEAPSAGHSSKDELFWFPESVLPLARTRGEKTEAIDEQYRPKNGDRVRFAIFRERYDFASEWLQDHGWERLESNIASVDGQESEDPAAGSDAGI